MVHYLSSYFTFHFSDLLLFKDTFPLNDVNMKDLLSTKWSDMFWSSSYPRGLTINYKLCGLTNAISIHTILTIILKNNIPQKAFYQMNNGALWTHIGKHKQFS